MESKDIMKISEILTEAKKLINTPEKWCKGASNGEQVCALEALYCSIGNIRVSNRDECYQLAKKQLAYDLCWDESAYSFYIIEFNDRSTTTHEDVMNLYNEAIERCMADGI